MTPILAEGASGARDAARPARSPTDQLVEAIERLLLGGIGLTARSLAEVEGAAELTLPQWRVLVIVGEADSLRIGELAARLGISVPSASRLVHRMEGHGLVSAERATDDRRATDVGLTVLGQRVRDAVFEHRRELVAAATGPLIGTAGRETIRLVDSIADALAAYA